MGNWRTVRLTGTVSADDLPALQRWVNIGDDWDDFHPLCNVGFSLCGLGDWTGTEMSAVGNLAERDYEPADVADALRKAVEVAPSLTLKVHCGGDWEAKECAATVTVADGQVSVGAPEVPVVCGDELGDKATANLMRAMTGQVETR